jgi:hypothetical protein
LGVCCLTSKTRMAPPDNVHSAATAKVPAFAPPAEEPLGEETPTVVDLGLRRPGRTTEPFVPVSATRATLAELEALTGLRISVAQAELLEREARRLEGVPGPQGPLRFFAAALGARWRRALEAEAGARGLFPVATLGDDGQALVLVDFDAVGWPVWRHLPGPGLEPVSASWAEFAETLG